MPNFISLIYAFVTKIYLKIIKVVLNFVKIAITRKFMKIYVTCRKVCLKRFYSRCLYWPVKCAKIAVRVFYSLKKVVIIIKE